MQKVVAIPTMKDLRVFGLMVGSIVVLIGGWPALMREEPIRLWAFMAGIPLILLGLAVPSLLLYPYRGWMAVGNVLSWINTRLILGIVFFGLITPMGLFMRLLGKDSMRLAGDRDVPSYRVIRSPRKKGHMLNQF